VCREEKNSAKEIKGKEKKHIEIESKPNLALPLQCESFSCPENLALWKKDHCFPFTNNHMRLTILRVSKKNTPLIVGRRLRNGRQDAMPKQRELLFQMQTCFLSYLTTSGFLRRFSWLDIPSGQTPLTWRGRGTLQLHFLDNNPRPKRGKNASSTFR
jgi:hypothetical protein